MSNLVPADLLTPIRRLDASRRFMLLGGLAGAVVVVYFVARWAVTPSYVNLFQQPLGLGEAQQYGAQLAQDNVPYRIVDGGANIAVPASQMARLRVAFASRAIGMQGCDGTPAFAIGSGAIEQQLVRTRTIRDQLACAISGMQGISRAQVSLTLQEQSPFRRLRTPAKASVVVWPNPGNRISPETVEAITYMVSSAVDGLDASRVAVINGQGGFALQAPTEDGIASARSSRELAIQRGIEQHLANKVGRLLDPLLTPGEFQVQVSAELDWTEIVRRSERFDPEGQAIVREQTNEIPPGASGVGSPPYNSEERESRFSRTVEDLTRSPGDIERLSVAVVVNDRAELFGGTPDGTTPPDPAVQARQLARIESVVRVGVGYDSTRGDEVVVSAVPFVTVGDSVVAASGGSIEGPLLLVSQILRPVVGLIGVLVVAFLSLRFLRQVATTAPSERQAGTSSLPPETPAAGLAAAAGMAPRIEPAPPATPQDNPDTAAQVVKAWLQEA